MATKDFDGLFISMEDTQDTLKDISGKGPPKSVIDGQFLFQGRPKGLSRRSALRTLSTDHYTLSDSFMLSHSEFYCFHNQSL